MYRHHRQLRRMTLGTFPAICLADARDRAKEMLVEAIKGNDPARIKQLDRNTATFVELAFEYIERYAKLKKKSWLIDERLLKKDFLHELGNIRAKDVTRKDILRVLDSISDRGSPTMANRSLEVVRKMFNFAVERDFVDYNPCYRISQWCLTLSCGRRLGIEGLFRNISRNTLDHDVTLNQVRMSLETVGLGANWVPEHVLRFKAWQGRTQTGKVLENVPDGILTVEKKGEYLAVAVELEMTAKNSERYAKTLKAYRCKPSLSMIWYLVPTKALGEKIERIWKKTNGTSDSRLKWSLISQVLNTPKDIELHCQESTRLLRDAISLKQPAHSTAHGVSSILE